jgi:hypothetical protein
MPPRNRQPTWSRISEHIKPEHPPNQKQADDCHDNMADPLTRRLGISEVEHVAMVASRQKAEPAITTRLLCVPRVSPLTWKSASPASCVRHACLMTKKRLIEWRTASSCIGGAAIQRACKLASLSNCIGRGFPAYDVGIHPSAADFFADLINDQKVDLIQRQSGHP